jgi:hypothetical protein
MSNIGLAREYATLQSEKKMTEMALKGHQNELANKLRGSMGEDMKKALEPKKENKAWKRFKQSSDNFLNLLQ